MIVAPYGTSNVEPIVALAAIFHEDDYTDKENNNYQNDEPWHNTTVARGDHRYLRLSVRLLLLNFGDTLHLHTNCIESTRLPFAKNKCRNLENTSSITSQSLAENKR